MIQEKFLNWIDSRIEDCENRLAHPEAANIWSQAEFFMWKNKWESKLATLQQVRAMFQRTRSQVRKELQQTIYEVIG
jgi:hypothetical protein